MEEVSHKGKIIDINPDYTTVEIISESACSSCHAAGICGISEYTSKAVEVPSSAKNLFEVGDEVEVVFKASMGHKAVWLAYVVPLIVLIAFILVPSSLGMSELLCALCGLVSVAVYYLLLYAFRDRLKDEYIFTIRELE